MRRLLLFCALFVAALPALAQFPFGFWKTVVTGASAPATFVDPTSIAGLKLWLKADALSLADGTAVSSWTDSSGLGYHATQGTGANQPLFKTNIVNGKPAIRFDGSNDVLVSATAANGAHTIFVAAKFVGTPASYAPEVSYSVQATTGGFDHGAPHFVKSNLTGAAYIPRTAGNGPVMTSYDGVGTYVVGTPYIFELPFAQSTTWSSYKDGTAESGATIGTGYATDISHLQIGAQVSVGINRYSNIDILEVIVYDSALSPADRSTIRQYLGTKYAITVVP